MGLRGSEKNKRVRHSSLLCWDIESMIPFDLRLDGWFHCITLLSSILYGYIILVFRRPKSPGDGDLRKTKGKGTYRTNAIASTVFPKLRPDHRNSIILFG